MAESDLLYLGGGRSAILFQKFDFAISLFRPLHQTFCQYITSKRLLVSDSWKRLYINIFVRMIIDVLRPLLCTW